MKRTGAILAPILLVLVASMAATPARAEVSFGFFYSSLEPHGAWQVSAQYGRVWQPAAYAPGWNPYYDGHWVHTDLGWTWVSDYPWGAIPYHYGTWVVDPFHGWVWVPGYTWAPAWVTFRSGPGYIGWAPVAPGFSLSMSLGSAYPATSAYVFVPARHFAAPRIRTVVVPQARNAVVYRGTSALGSPAVRNGVVVNRGPDVAVVQRGSPHPVRRMKVEEVTRVAPFENTRRSELAVDRRDARRPVRATAPAGIRSGDVARGPARAREDRRPARQEARSSRPRDERVPQADKPQPMRKEPRQAPAKRQPKPQEHKKH